MEEGHIHRDIDERNAGVENMLIHDYCRFTVLDSHSIDSLTISSEFPPCNGPQQLVSESLVAHPRFGTLGYWAPAWEALCAFRGAASPSKKKDARHMRPSNGMSDRNWKPKWTLSRSWEYVVQGTASFKCITCLTGANCVG